MTIPIPRLNRVRDLAVSHESSPEHACFLPQRIEGMKRALTAAELAAILAISPITVYKMAKAGRLPSLRIGTAVRFDPRAIAEWLRGNLG
jgi:excisionase family DNA binding protein